MIEPSSRRDPSRSLVLGTPGEARALPVERDTVTGSPGRTGDRRAAHLDVGPVALLEREGHRLAPQLHRGCASPRSVMRNSRRSQSSGRRGSNA